MKKHTGILLTLLVLATLILVTACGGREPQTVIQVTPPASESQVRAVPPPPAPVWVPGQWIQEGPYRTWRPGHWE